MMMRTRHVLLVEPDVVLARTYVAALRTKGYTVQHVASAQAAITQADAQTPDVVIVELQLAAHSGAAFLYEFRSYTDWLHVPIIVQTVIPPDQLQIVAESLQELGVVACLYKPQTTLQKMVRAVGRQMALAA